MPSKKNNLKGKSILRTLLFWRLMEYWHCFPLVMMFGFYIWIKVSKNGPGKIFKGCLSQILLGPFLNTLSHFSMTCISVLFDKLIPFHQFFKSKNQFMLLSAGDLFQGLFVQFQNSCFPEILFTTNLYFRLKRSARITRVYTHKILLIWISELSY